MDTANQPKRTLTPEGETKVTPDKDVRELLGEILVQLKIANMHLTAVSGQTIDEEDIDA